MSSIPFYVPVLKDAGAWEDLRSKYPGGYGWRGDRPLGSIIKVGIHHSVTNPQNSLIKEVDYIKRIHVDGNQWGGIGYNFIISSEEINGYAKTGYVGDLGSIRAHTPDTKGVYVKAGTGNYYYIGICMVGMLHQVLPTDAQMRSAHALVNEVIYAEDVRLPGLKTWADMIPHKQVDPTACPGRWDEYRDKIISGVINNQDMKEIEDLKKQVASITTERDNAMRDRDAWKVTASGLQTDVDGLRNDVSGLKSNLSTVTLKLNSVVGNLDSLTNQVKNLLEETETDSMKTLKGNYRAYKEGADEVQSIKNSGAYKVAQFFIALIPGIKPKTRGLDEDGK